VCVWVEGGDSCGADSHLLQLIGSCQEAAGCSKVTADATAVDLAIAVGCRSLWVSGLLFYCMGMCHSLGTSTSLNGEGGGAGCAAAGILTMKSMTDKIPVSVLWHDHVWGQRVGLGVLGWGVILGCLWGVDGCRVNPSYAVDDLRWPSGDSVLTLQLYVLPPALQLWRHVRRALLAAAMAAMAGPRRSSSRCLLPSAIGGQFSTAAAAVWHFQQTETGGWGGGGTNVPFTIIKLSL